MSNCAELEKKVKDLKEKLTKAAGLIIELAGAVQSVDEYGDYTSELKEARKFA